MLVLESCVDLPGEDREGVFIRVGYKASEEPNGETARTSETSSRRDIGHGGDFDAWFRVGTAKTFTDDGVADLIEGADPLVLRIFEAVNRVVDRVDRDVGVKVDRGVDAVTTRAEVGTTTSQSDAERGFGDQQGSASSVTRRCHNTDWNPSTWGVEVEGMMMEASAFRSM